MLYIKHDFIVIGSGLAGLSTAYALASKGKVALIAEIALEDSNSFFAQGGMAAVIDPTDNPKAHYEDTMEAGRGLCNPEAVSVLTEEAPLRIQELIDMGMTFDADANGNLSLGLEGGHHHKRILHAGGDATGRAVTSFMIEKVKQSPNITVLAHHHLANLIVEEETCKGIWSYDKNSGEMLPIFASVVVLATGGAAALYAPTTNPPTALGDGIALAYQVGATIADMEFVQFHPTALSVSGKPSFLISEAVRGEGAYLKDKHGKRFMRDIHELAELAPRDIVARSIYQKMQEEDMQQVTLSLEHIDKSLLMTRFPNIYAHCQEMGLDFTDQIPVAPAAHYTVGGILTDLNGHTNIMGLYAVGEVASTGLMGANRLASNSLVECLVFSHRIALHVADSTKTLSDEDCKRLINTYPAPKTSSINEEREWQANIGAKVMKKLGMLLTKHVGIVRNAVSIHQGIEKLHALMQKVTPYSPKLFSARETLLRIEVAEMIAKGALKREESRGGHYRSDFQQTLSKEACYHTHFTNGKIKHTKIK